MDFHSFENPDELHPGILSGSLLFMNIPDIDELNRHFNSVDPYEMHQNAVYDKGLYCLQKKNISSDRNLYY